MTCARCGRELQSGEVIYEQTQRTITARGRMVRIFDNTIIVCKGCMK